MKQILTLAFVFSAFFVFPIYTFAGYGSAPSAPVCNNEKPGQAYFSYIIKSASNQIEVGWNTVDRATSWTIAYGIESGKYIYGMADFGDNQSRSVNINLLPQGTYYFVIKANNGCMPGSFSPERKITVTGDGRILGTKTAKKSLGVILGNRVTPSPEISTTTVPSEPIPTISNQSPTTTPEKPQNNFWSFLRNLWQAIFGK